MILCGQLILDKSENVRLIHNCMHTAWSELGEDRVYVVLEILAFLNQSLDFADGMKDCCVVPVAE
jgi:hypothetical protein